MKTKFVELSDHESYRMVLDKCDFLISLERLQTKSGEIKTLLHARTRSWSRLIDAFDPPSPYESVFVAQNKNRVLFFGGKVLLLYDAGNDQHILEETGRSDWLGELNFIDLIAIEDSSSALVYECGVIVFNERIEIKKFYRHVLNDKFVSIQGNTITFCDDSEVEYDIQY